MVYALLLALIALTGYIYCHTHPQEKKKLAWHAQHGGLYYRYAASGLFFALVGYLLYFVLYLFRPEPLVHLARLLAAPIGHALPGSWASIHLFLGTTILGMFAAWARGRIGSYFAKRNKSKAIYKEVNDTEDSFSRVMLIAMENRLTVMVTLDDGKVYIGHPLEFYSPYLDHRWIQILPVMSGYRVPRTKSLKLTTDYTHSIHGYYDKRMEELAGEALPPRLDDFAQTIRTQHVQSFTLFDIGRYVDQVTHEEAPLAATAATSSQT